MNVGNATVIEIIWTAVTLVGTTANAWGLADAIADRRWLRDSGLNGRRAIVSRWHVVLNSGLTYVQVAFLVAGIVACTTPSPHDRNVRIARAALQLLFLSAEPVLVYVAIAARRYRGQLLASRSIRATRPLAAELADEGDTL